MNILCKVVSFDFFAHLYRWKETHILVEKIKSYIEINTSIFFFILRVFLIYLIASFSVNILSLLILLL
jgi:hypothetical protein